MDMINKNEIEMLSVMVQEELSTMNEHVENFTNAKTDVKKKYFKKKIEKIRPRVLYLMQILENMRPVQKPEEVLTLVDETEEIEDGVFEEVKN